MSELFKQVAANGPPTTPRDAVVTLLGALLLGWIVGWVYARTRPPSNADGSFRVTLVLLAILIAIVTQVVGGNEARAFSLVGALSIVRFRTVVQDTQDAAFAIFAVVMGMAAGANDIWIAMMGIILVSAGAFVMNRAPSATAMPPFGFTLYLRVGLGHDVDALVLAPFATHVANHRLVSLQTAKQGTEIEASYQVDVRSDGSVEGLVKTLNRTEGVHHVQLREVDLDVG